MTSQVQKRNDFAERLCDLMEKSGTTQQQIAEKIGTTRQTVSQYMGGDIEPKMKAFVAIAEYFGVSCDYLLGKTDVKSRNITTQSLHKSTGLSEASINNLRNLKKSDPPQEKPLNFVNALLGDAEALYFLSEAYCDYYEIANNPEEYFAKEEAYTKVVEKIDNPLVFSIEGRYESEEYAIYKCQKRFSNFLEKQKGGD